MAKPRRTNKPKALKKTVRKTTTSIKRNTKKY